MIEPRKKKSQWNYIWKDLVAGGIAGAASRTVVSPMERLKILFQVQSGMIADAKVDAKYTGIVGSLRKIAVEEGVRGYFKGNAANILRIVPYSAVQFSTYGQFKKLLGVGKTNFDTAERLLAGALAGICAVGATYPLDLARTRLSVDNVVAVTGSKSTTGSILQVIKHIYRTEGGIKGCFRGINPTLMGVAPYNACNFTVYEALRSKFVRPGEQPPATTKLLCGAVAGACAQTVSYPLELIRRRFQVMGLSKVSYNYTSTWDGIRSVIRTDGFRGLFQGAVPNYLKVIPAMGVSFVVYEWVIELLG